MMFVFIQLACTSSEEAIPACTDCRLTDANNYQYTSDLSIGRFPLPEHADATIDWSALTRDIRGGEIEAGTDLTEARLIAFHDLPADEVEVALSHDELAQADVGAYVTCAPSDSSCTLSEFGMFGNHLDIQQYFQEGYGSWLIALGQPGEPGADALAFLVPTPGSTETSAVLTDSTSSLAVDVSLVDVRPVVLPAVEPEVTLDWSGLAHDGLGDVLDPATIDELWIGRFEETPEELEANIFSMEEMADAVWTSDVDGISSVSLTELEGELPFLGIDGQGTWVLALRCDTCTNPAPRLLTLLQAE